MATPCIHSHTTTSRYVLMILPHTSLGMCSAELIAWHLKWPMYHRLQLPNLSQWFFFEAIIIVNVNIVQPNDAERARKCTERRRRDLHQTNPEQLQSLHIIQHWWSTRKKKRESPQRRNKAIQCDGAQCTPGISDSRASGGMGEKERTRMLADPDLHKSKFRHSLH